MMDLQFLLRCTFIISHETTTIGQTFPNSAWHTLNLSSNVSVSHSVSLISERSTEFVKSVWCNMMLTYSSSNDDPHMFQWGKGTHLKFDRDKGNINKVLIGICRSYLVNKPGPKPHGSSKDRLGKYTGTTSTVPLPRCGSPQYWEVKGRVNINQTLPTDGLLLETGLCREEERDQHHCINGCPQSYSLTVNRCTTHGSICRKVWRHGKYVLCLSDTLPNTPGQSTTLHYGVVYDDARCRVAFIDVTDNTVISTLNDVDCSRPLWPMFGVYNPDWASVSMSLVVGKDIDMPEAKKSLILRTLHGW